MISPAFRSRGSVVLLLLLVALASAGCELRNAEAVADSTPGDLMTRTELFLGMSRPNGADVTDAEFQAFLDEEVTPRFPQGYTVMNADGRWRDTATGKTIKEPTRILVLIYKAGDSQEQAIEAIRNAYKSKFNQQAVLRTDDGHRGSF